MVSKLIKKKILDIFAYLQLRNNYFYKKITFFNDGQISSFDQINEKHLKCTLAKNILEFLENVNFFYDNMEINANLHISGAWKTFVNKSREEQIYTYDKKNIEKICVLHENMFYNCLLQGLWAYSHFKDLKSNIQGMSHFYKDLRLFDHTFDKIDILENNNPLNKWGYSFKNKKFIFTTMTTHAHGKIILNTLNLLKKEKFNVLDLGSGFGPLAEFLFQSQKINSIMLVDVPANLVTAYYYLSNKYGLEKVKILKTRNEIQDYREKFKKNNLILLIPSCFYDEIRNYDLNLISNFGSFSEMGYKTIEYYLQNLPSSIEIICSINSNTDHKLTEDHQEVQSEKFPWPSSFAKIFEHVSFPLFSNYRYKTLIYKKN